MIKILKRISHNWWLTGIKVAIQMEWVVLAAKMDIHNKYPKVQINS